MNSRNLLAAALAASFLAFSPLASAQSGNVNGEVLEIQNVEGYSYLRLKTAEGETWAAVPTADVKKGAKVTLTNVMVMQNFESKALKRKFDKVLFASIDGAKGGAPAPSQGNPHAAMPAPGAAAPAAKPIVVDKVAKATAADAKTVAEIATGAKALKDKPVTVRGRVVKVNTGILGKNWLHLQDGTGTASNGSNDVIVTTTAMAAVGDVVTASGTVRTNVTVGQGYAFDVMVEDAKIQK